MGTNALRGRENWQTNSGGKAVDAEKDFFSVFNEEFAMSEFRIQAKPNEFRNIYNTVNLSKEVLEQIYDPGRNWIHGFVPDYAIRNLKSEKTLYVEVKRQDGWVEGKEPSAGRGNAHERSNKYFTPGLLRLLREHGKLGNDVLPFWVVFQGDIARDPKRVREVTYWYAEYSAHFFMWIDSTDSTSLIAHFNNKLKHLLL